MTTELYHLHKDGASSDIYLDPKAKLQDVRNQLKVLFSQYQFVYINPVTNNKTLLHHQKDEQQARLAPNFVLPGNIVLLANVSSTNPDYFGHRTSFFRDRNMGVSVSYNTEDGDPLDKNDKIRFEPLMLEDVEPANPDSDVFFENMVICQKGMPVKFGVSSWGAAGFGYSIKTDREPICNWLSVAYSKGQFGSTQWASIRRYQGNAGQPGSTIVIDSLKDKGYNTSLKAEYSKVTVKTWRMTSYRQQPGGEVFASDLAAPSPRLAAEEDGSGMFDGPAEGDVYVSDNSVEAAAPSAGKPSSQTIGTIYDTKEDGEDHVLGAVTFYLFVFKDKAAVNEVMKIINSKDSVPFPGIS